jgi:aminoglycoside phosphotransferase (APT) family kinase protein
VPRTATLVLWSSAGPCGGRVLGTLPALQVDSPWWPHVEPVVAAARERFGVDVTVLRLLEADGRGPGGGTGAYLAEVGDEPDADSLAEGHRLRGISALQDPLRMPWARPGGVAADVAWADRELAAAGTPRNGPAVQVKSWNLSSVLRLPTVAGPFWCKHVPPFFAHEGQLLAALATSDPDLVPAPVARRRDPDGTGVTLMDGVPGVDQWEAPERVLQRMLRGWVGAQAAWAGRVDELAALGVPDWRTAALLDDVRGLVARADVRERLTDAERAALDALVAALPARLAALGRCGLPATLVHGDLHPGNWIGDGDRLALVDWGDSAIGHPMLDTVAFLSRVPAGSVRERLRDVVVRQWRGRCRSADPLRAIELVEPVAALRAALTYRTFLDGIEESERPYHADDVPAMLRLALSAAGRAG